MLLKSTVCSILCVFFLVSNLKSTKITLTLLDIISDDFSDGIYNMDLDTEEDNRQKMKSLLKEIRVRLLAKFKKNKKHRKKTGTFPVNEGYL